jgi:hypothetical protein
LETHQLLRNGPSLRVILPDVLPPDWDALEADLDVEIEEPVDQATVVAPSGAPADLALKTVLRVASRVARRGARVHVEHRELVNDRGSKWQRRCSCSEGTSLV